MKIGLKGEHFKRAGWLLLALLFIVTGLGVGIYAFWANTHPAKNSTNTTQGANVNKLAGTNLTNFTPTTNIPSLQAIDVKVGTGAEAKPSSNVTVDYTGAVAATGLIFQSSLDTGQPASFSLAGNLIPGWKQGVPGMKVGGTRRLLIPSALAYGANPPPGSGISANADLVFDITLLGAK